MSLEIETYLTKADDSLIEPWMMRLLDLGMQCEPHPDFSFATQEGFLPFKLRLLRPTRSEFKDKEFLTGFEFYRSEFDISTMPIAEPHAAKGIKRFIPSRKKEPSFRISPTVDDTLSKCNYQLTFRWGSADVFELRMADLSSLVLLELAGGIRYLPFDSKWEEKDNTVEFNLSEIEQYEQNLSPGKFEAHQFDGWVS